MPAGGEVRYVSLRCSFCGGAQGPLIKLRSNAHICAQCVDLGIEVVEEEFPNPDQRGVRRRAPSPPTPRLEGRARRRPGPRRTTRFEASVRRITTRSRSRSSRRRRGGPSRRLRDPRSRAYRARSARQRPRRNEGVSLAEAGWFLVGAVLGCGFVGAIPGWLAVATSLALGSAATWSGWHGHP